MSEDTKTNNNQLEVVKSGAVENIKKKGKSFMSKKYAKPVIISMATILFLAIIFSVFVCVNKVNSNVYKNVYILGQNVSGYTTDGLVQLINEKNSEKDISIYQGTENIYSVKSTEIDFGIDVTSTVNKALSFGRDSNVFKNSFNIIKAKFKKVDIDPVYTYDEEKIDGVIKNIELSLKDRFVEDSYSLDDASSKLIITKGKSGNAIDYQEVENALVDTFKTDEKSLIINTIVKKPDTIDVDKIYEEVKKDPKDAYVDEKSSPVKFVKEEPGIDFDKEELKRILNLDENKEEGKVIEFPITVKEPQVKLTDITASMYNDKLAGYTTYFDASNYARGNNLEIALRYLNGKVIMPGETFSYNNAIGDTTSSKGYLPAAVFKAGTVEYEVGGGICQTTSTLYNVALMANLEIVERHQHGLPVGYVPPSRDATVYIGVLDFKFKNTRQYPVKIVTSYSWNGTMNISLYGTKEENEYEVILSSSVTSTIPYTTKYNYDANIPQGRNVVVSKGVNGYNSEGYITKKLNGQVVSSGLLSRDSYKAQQEIITCGTGNVGS